LFAVYAGYSEVRAWNMSRYDGVMHGFFTMPHLIDTANRAITEASQALWGAFGF
jgi:hypothetical protein